MRGGTEGAETMEHAPEPAKTSPDTDLSTLCVMQSQENRALRNEIERVYQRYSDVPNGELLYN